MDANEKKIVPILVPDIIIVSQEDDPHTDAVFNYLHEKHQQVVVTIIDTAQFPQTMEFNIAMSSSVSKLKIIYPGYQAISVEKLRSIWWWRPQFPSIDNHIQDSNKAEFAYRECCQVIEGLWYINDCLWVNHPERQEVAFNCLYQLQLAKSMNFRIPETLVTNSARAVVDFWNKHEGEVMFKQLLPLAPKAFRLTPEIMKKIGNLNVAPLMFQEMVKLDAMLHLIVIGDRVFASRLLSYSKKDGGPEMKNYPLPQDIGTQVLNLAKAVGLFYLKIEMGIDKNSKYIFLGMDPTGSFLAEQMATGLPLTEILAELLLRGKIRENQRLWPMMPS